MADLNGCYFAKGPNALFEIRSGKLLSPEVTSSVFIASTSSDSSVLSFSPGIRPTENSHKEMMVVQGSEVSGLAFKRGDGRYILLAGEGFPLQLEQRECRQRSG